MLCVCVQVCLFVCLYKHNEWFIGSAATYVQGMIFLMTCFPRAAVAVATSDLCPSEGVCT